MIAENAALVCELFASAPDLWCVCIQHLLCVHSFQHTTARLFPLLSPFLGLVFIGQGDSDDDHPRLDGKTNPKEETSMCREKLSKHYTSTHTQLRDGQALSLFFMHMSCPTKQANTFKGSFGV